ncbi:nitrogen-fixing NifU domain protein [Candidatus Moduliflexus flocculans]|uniref:Nitrogen-fixing NifU domain protein n=1 Tax=Candidatus Moduliflexus flocculans TaxID=1499966 RepID=A0A081BPA8_9BACT|nr:nitrogen-fixing NifU domain protein [Candidatus Moduliflexus flocculans]
MEQNVIDVLETIRPMLQQDGGDVQFVNIDQEGTVQVKLQGACGHCPGAAMTLKALIEKRLKQEVPEITRVVAV